jgi:alkaline phosphatase D
MKKTILFFLIFCLLPSYFAIAQKKLLQSGPMVGYSSMREVMLWVQTNAPAQIKFAYFEQGQPDTRQFTETQVTKVENLLVAQIAASTEPGLKYQYELYINEQKIAFDYPLAFQSQALWQWRTDPPDFEFALGSCTYINETPYDRPGKPYGGEYQIFEAIRAKKPDFMLWMGDNIYLREADWEIASGIYKRYTHTRSTPEMQALLASTHNYAIWDDHDFGPNDSDRSYWLKDEALRAFKLFWANPGYAMEKGTASTFTWNDCQFFMLDNRYFRSPQNRLTGERAYLGDEQLTWLIDALVASKATFKFIVVGGQVLNDHKAEWLENYDKYPEEKAKLISEIENNQISGVIFLDGDRHHTELSKLERPGNYPLYDLTVSPLTAGPVGDRAKDEPNSYRVAGTYFGERNFGLLNVSGPRKERVLTIRIMDNAGKEIWKKDIKASELEK